MEETAITKEAQDQKSTGEHPEFLCGVAVSVYQNSGDPNSNWAFFERQKQAHVNFRLRLTVGSLSTEGDASCGTSPGLQEHNQPVLQVKWPKLGPSKIVKNFRIGDASDFWNRYQQDIELAKDLGCNSFRISIEWSRLYPRRGCLDQDAVARYDAIFDSLDRHGMEPNVTLHWFVHPQWFQEMGAFTKEANIAVWVEWATEAFRLFGKRARLWTTFNEPTVASMCGYITGNHPPGKLLNFKAAGRYLLNILRGHAEAYKAIKAMPGGKDVMVGLCHNVFWTEPKSGGPLYAHVRAAVGFGNRVWGNESVMTYLKTGRFRYWVPTGRAIVWEDPAGKPGCDFFGLNHYARGVVDWKLMPSNKSPGGLADMGYPVYPPSLYRAISYSSTLGVPVYVLENGMPCQEDDERRAEWIDGCLAEVRKAIRDGYDVRGYFYWTLVDNFEWNFAWELKFGLYEWHPDGTQRRRLRNGAKVAMQGIKKWYEKFPRELGDLLAQRRGLGGVKPREERERLERETEEEWLRGRGLSEDQVRAFVSQDSNPIVAGIY